MAQVSPEIREQLVQPFIEGACLALREMANTELVIREVYRQTSHRTLGDVSAVIGLHSASEGALVLSFPKQTALALARRLLAGVAPEPDDALVRDSLGELANVIAGQAKTLLNGTPYHFLLAIPRVVSGAGEEIGPHVGGDCVVIALGSDAGEFAMQLYLGYS